MASSAARVVLQIEFSFCDFVDEIEDTGSLPPPIFNHKPVAIYTYLINVFFFFKMQRTPGRLLYYFQP